MSASSADWQPSASLAHLQARARLYADIRRFFAERQVLEVETPILSHAGNTDPHIESFSSTLSQDSDTSLYLHTSPEFPMKRLLAAGSGPIYQICKVFRQDEEGAWHNPEFTMLEWYRPGFDHHQLISELAALVHSVVPAFADFKVQKLSYQQVFKQLVGLDPLHDPVANLRDFVMGQGLQVQGLNLQERDPWLDLIMGHFLQPQLGQGQLTFIYDYPASQAALARINPNNRAVAERFELFIAGVELANGYHELLDAAELRRRFQRDLAYRQKNNQKSIPYDENLLRAMEHGLPPCAGVSVGLDRLVSLMQGQNKLQNGLAFSIKHA